MAADDTRHFLLAKPLMQWAARFREAQITYNSAAGEPAKCCDMAASSGIARAVATSRHYAMPLIVTCGSYLRASSVNGF